MKMSNTLSHTNISNLQESVKQFFLLHETIASLELDLSASDAESKLVTALYESFQQNNPFEVN